MRTFIRSRKKRYVDNKVLMDDHEMLDVERRKNLSYTRDDSDNDDDDDLTRNQKTKVATSICIGPTCFDLCDDVLLFSLFRNAQVFRDTGYRYGKPEQVQIKVLSTILCRDNFELPEDEGVEETKIEKKVRKSVFVGEVIEAPEDCTLKKGDLVTSLRKGPVSAYQLTASVDALLSIPAGIDTGEATALMSTFLPAMGLLFHGVVDRIDRFSNIALRGCDVLVTGGGRDEAGSVVCLALLSGANRVFVLQSKTSLATTHAESVRVELVSDDPNQWHPVIDRYMDVIIDLEFPKNFESLYGILKNSGRMVCLKPPKTDRLSVLRDIGLELNLLRYPSASIYDIDKQIEDEHPQMVRDMRYLFRLLQRRKVRPHVERFITCKDIQSTREHMRLNPGSGAVICEPWR